MTKNKARKIISTINRGNKILRALIKILKKSGLLLVLEEWKRIIVEYELVESSMPIFEKKLLIELGIDETEQKIILSIIKHIIQDTPVSFEDIYRNSIKQLDKINEILLDSNNEFQKDVLVYATAGGKVFGGAILIIINLLGFYASIGLVVTEIGSITSSISGFGLMLDGSRLIGLRKIDRITDTSRAHYVRPT